MTFRLPMIYANDPLWKALEKSIREDDRWLWDENDPMAFVHEPTGMRAVYVVNDSTNLQGNEVHVTYPQEKYSLRFQDKSSRDYGPSLKQAMDAAMSNHLKPLREKVGVALQMFTDQST